MITFSIKHYKMLKKILFFRLISNSELVLNVTPNCKYENLTFQYKVHNIILNNVFYNNIFIININYIVNSKPIPLFTKST